MLFFMEIPLHVLHVLQSIMNMNNLFIIVKSFFTDQCTFKRAVTISLEPSPSALICHFSLEQITKCANTLCMQLKE